jgi:hypothetical protein
MQGKFLGYPQQQCYGEDSLWMEAKAQQQQSHGFHQDSYSTDHSNYYDKNQFPLPAMHMKPGGFGKESDHSFSKHHGHGSNLGGNHNMFHQDSMSNGHGHGHGHGHGYGNNHGLGNGQKFPFGATNTHSPHHGSGVRPFNHHGGGHNNDYVSDHEEYEFEAYKEERIGSGASKMDEMRYERHGTYGGDVHYANPYGYNNNNRIKPHGHGSHKVNWTLKGV